ncbi:MAG: hypothetical protein JXA95_09230 [Spirochaetales bacterium]|nr:hypothetical protein [Spirochaetales bacterium]
MVKIDLHLHTNRHSPCSRLSVEELTAMVPFIGMDGIVLTEHNWQWTREEADELQARLGSVKLYRGMEADVREGHFLVIGADYEGLWDRNRTLRDLLDMALPQGGAVIWAHPGRLGPIPENLGDLSEFAELAGIEVMSANIQNKLQKGIEGVLKTLKKPPVAGSDSHVAMTLGTYATLFPELPADEKALAAMINAPLGVPWANRKAIIPINSKYKAEEEKLLLSSVISPL